MDKNQFEHLIGLMKVGEMLPIYLIKDIMNYKITQRLEDFELIKYYIINNDISYNFLKNYKGKDYYKLYTSLKFSMNKHHLNELYNKLSISKKKKNFFPIKLIICFSIHISN